jgi:hypothetical protein
MSSRGWGVDDLENIVIDEGLYLTSAFPTNRLDDAVYGVDYDFSFETATRTIYCSVKYGDGKFGSRVKDVFHFVLTGPDKSKIYNITDARIFFVKEDGTEIPITEDRSSWENLVTDDELFPLDTFYLYESIREPSPDIFISEDGDTVDYLLSYASYGIVYTERDTATVKTVTLKMEVDNAISDTEGETFSTYFHLTVDFPHEVWVANYVLTH